MSQTLSLIAKNQSKLALVLDTTEIFLDANENVVGNGSPPNKGLADPMLEVIQSTDVTVTVQLLNPDGTNFDLTGVTGLQMGIFQRTPTRQTIAIAAGFSLGAPTDGLTQFVLAASGNNYIGFARGMVTCVKAGKNLGFETFEAKYVENLFVPLP